MKWQGRLDHRAGRNNNPYGAGNKKLWISWLRAWRVKTRTVFLTPQLPGEAELWISICRALETV